MRYPIFNVIAYAWVLSDTFSLQWDILNQRWEWKRKVFRRAIFVSFRRFYKFNLEVHIGVPAPNPIDGLVRTVSLVLGCADRGVWLDYMELFLHSNRISIEKTQCHCHVCSACRDTQKPNGRKKLALGVNVTRIDFNSMRVKTRFDIFRFSV